jgi:DNA topoisomerase-3
MESIVRFVNFLVNSAEKANRDIKFEKEEKKPYSKSGKARKTAEALGACPVCEKGKIHENTKAYYCDQWKSGCAFTVWKNALEIYGIKITPAFMKDLLKSKKVEGVLLTLPQTKEDAVADILIDKEKTPMVQIVNLKRVEKKG